MALAIKDRVKELTTTTGTGTLTLVSAPSGFRRFSSVLSDGDTTYYCIESGNSWEVGVGTYSANTLARTTVLASSNANALVNITAARSFVFVTYPADKAVYKDGSDRTLIGAAGLIFSDNTVQTTAPVSVDLTPYALLPDTLPAVGTLLSYGGSRQLAAGGTVTHSGALTIGGNLSIGANSLVGAYSGIYNENKWLKGSDGYGAFWISPSNASFKFSPPAAASAAMASIDYAGRVNAVVGFAVGHHDYGITDVRYLRNATGPKASIRAAGGLEVKDLAGSADAAVTCGAITASGAVNISQHLEATLYLISNQGRVFARANGSAGFILGATDDTNINRISAGVIGIGTGAAGSTAGSLQCATITASGNLTVAAGSSSSYSVGTTSGTLVFGINTTKYVFGIGQISAGVQYLSGIAQSLIGFSSSTDPTANPDTAIARNAAGVLEINNGTAGTFRDLACRAITASSIIRQSAEITSTPSGTTQTLTLNDGNHQTLTLTSSTGDVTVTLTVPTSSSAGTLIIKQHGTTPRDITWAVSSGTIKWMGTEPTWASDAVNDVRIVSWRWNGSVMYLAATDVGT